MNSDDRNNLLANSNDGNLNCDNNVPLYNQSEIRDESIKEIDELFEKAKKLKNEEFINYTTYKNQG